MNLIRILLKMLARCEQTKSLHAPYRFCFYGYTDIMLSKSEWLEIIPPENYDRLVNRENRDSLVKIHNRPEVEKVPTLSSIQEVVFGNRIIIDVIDFQTYEGSELLIDLNKRAAPEMEQKYDAIFDNGTSEHVFNFPQVLMNSHLMTKVHGFIRHAVPINWPNHGFYSLSPTVFYDFYEDNAAATVECLGYFLDRSTNPPQHKIVTDLPKFDRFTSGIELIAFYTAQKKSHLAEFTFPVQRKYRDVTKWK